MVVVVMMLMLIMILLTRFTINMSINKFQIYLPLNFHFVVFNLTNIYTYQMHKVIYLVMY